MTDGSITSDPVYLAMRDQRDQARAEVERLRNQEPAAGPIELERTERNRAEAVARVQELARETGRYKTALEQAGRDLRAIAGMCSDEEPYPEVDAFAMRASGRTSHALGGPAKHDAYVDCLDGGWAGFQAACWDCHWRGPAHLRGDEEIGTPESRVHKRRAKADAARHRRVTS